MKIDPKPKASECPICPFWVWGCAHLGDDMVVMSNNLVSHNKECHLGHPSFSVYRGGYFAPCNCGQDVIWNISRYVCDTTDEDEAWALFRLEEERMLSAN